MTGVDAVLSGNVLRLDGSDSDRWMPDVLEHDPFPPYWWLRGVDGKERQALLQRDLENALRAGGSLLFGYFDPVKRIGGLLQAVRLDWDSRLFRKDLWSINHLGAWTGVAAERPLICSSLVKECQGALSEEKADGLLARVPIDNLSAVNALEGSGFRTVEVSSTWLFDFRDSIPPKRNPDWIRDSRAGDEGRLIELASERYSAIPDRFHVDSMFGDEAGNELYAAWMKNCCCGEQADFISVAEHDGKVLGYATVKDRGDEGGLLRCRIGQLGLGAMLPEYSSRGLVTDLVIHDLEWLKRRRASFCYVLTQGNNFASQRLFINAGFKPAMTALTLHYWHDARHPS